MKTQHWITRLGMLFRVAIGLVFLLLLDTTLVGSDFTLEPSVASYTEKPLVASAKRLGDTNLVLYPEGQPVERRFLQERLGEDDVLVAYRLGWQEYAGFALVGLFVINCFWFLSALATESWTEERRRQVVLGKLTAMAAVYFTYATAAGLGWVWLSAWPFGLMGACLLAFGPLLQRIPVSKPEKGESHESIGRIDVVI